MAAVARAAGAVVSVNAEAARALIKARPPKAIKNAAPFSDRFLIVHPKRVV
jgi:hypothetical protein